MNGPQHTGRQLAHQDVRARDQRIDDDAGLHPSDQRHAARAVVVPWLQLGQLDRHQRRLDRLPNLRIRQHPIEPGKPATQPGFDRVV